MPHVEHTHGHLRARKDTRRWNMRGTRRGCYVKRAICGVSGGRSSAMLALNYAASDTVLAFQNTGFEHPKTIEFLRRIEQDIGRPIVAMEYRAPPRGRPPRESTFEIVPWAALAMRGEPFLDMLECTRTFRETKGKGPIAPWAASRICTAYLKLKTQERFAASIGLGTSRDHEVLVGYRADEPLRVARMRERNSERDFMERAPLDENGITKADVMRFWSTKAYDLDLPEHLGNCTACFMKDERDLATALLEAETHAEIWIGIEDRYGPMRRGGRPSYEQVLSESGERMRIRAAIAAGTEPSSTLPPRRHRLVVKQERKPSESFSCACDAAMGATDDEVEAWA